MLKKLSAGSIVEMKCTRCRKVLNHTIVAMVGEKIARVECNTCHGVHNYHPVKPEKTAKPAKAPAAPKAPREKSAAPRVPKVDPAATAAAEWEALQSSYDPEQAIPYDMERTYRVNNLISHTQFGIGVVQGIVPPNKIDVLFQSGRKRLRCG